MKRLIEANRYSTHFYHFTIKQKEKTVGYTELDYKINLIYRNIKFQLDRNINKTVIFKV